MLQEDFITGKINAMIEDAGLSIIAQKRILLSEAQAESSTEYIRRGHFLEIW